METTNINGREFTITMKVDTNNAETPLVYADFIARGFDGSYYELTGKRGSKKIALRNATTGAFVVVS